MNKCCKSWTAEILPPLCSVTLGCYAITRRAARHESALLRTPVWQQCWFDSCKDDMCIIIRALILYRCWRFINHLLTYLPCPAQKAKLSLCNCYTPSWILYLYTEGLWCPGAIPQVMQALCLHLTFGMHQILICSLPQYVNFKSDYKSTITV